MFKKITIALMAVMVFAIPIGASAAISDSDKQLPYYIEIQHPMQTAGSLIQVYSPKPFVFVKEGDYYFLKGDSQYRPYNNGNFYSTLQNSSNTIMASSHISSATVFKSSHTLSATDGTVFFTAPPPPPPPPQPVKLEAVKTVEEILPQTGAVAGGIVLVASILLGLWLVIGLVRRLVFSYLR